MNHQVRRVFVEKKKGFDVDGQHLLHDLKKNLNIDIDHIRVINRYDTSHISEENFRKAVVSVFSEQNQDNVYYEVIELEGKTFAVEYLPGQYDQRADSAAQCIQLLTGNDKPVVKYGKIINIPGNIPEKDFERIKKYIINPVDSREADLIKPESLEDDYPEAADVLVLDDFTDKSNEELESFMVEIGFAMSLEDLKFCQNYFKNTEKRNPTVTELKVIDTYWSDHCRHTTFLTKFNKIDFEEGVTSVEVENVYKEYLEERKYVYGQRDKAPCLMDIATIVMKSMKKSDKLNDLEVSDEINACSIIVEADIDGRKEDWLVMFKNETHNHPTEIEPFGGAATCLGGAIRDPLSGRAYVYQAMRVTGCGDPTVDINDTIPGKLPQIKITTEAAHGYSSYGNQIGLATGKVEEIYHNDYIAKRMEIGAVIAASPKENVVREKPEKGDVIILVGGKTGRDGCGGATGSSKEHDEESILLCGSEVQKGNPPEERKIQRLFRNPDVSRMIIKCNDFGAGGISVAIGELADSLEINLDLVPKKYEGLDGTELAISESQERMAVVIAPGNVEKFIAYADEENLITAQVAKVTDTGRLIMNWKGKNILNISREFLETNGISQNIDIKVTEPEKNHKERFMDINKDKFKESILQNLQDLNCASGKGLSERFDASIGAGTVAMPFGGKYQLTPMEGMIGKLPLLKGETKTCTLMSHGFDPYMTKWSTFHGAQYAVIHSVAKIVAMGGDYKNVRLTLQEYFEKLNKDKEKWGKPFTALLGAFKAQKEFQIPAIGGKDSMSGTFKDLNVPPTLVSFAVGVSNTDYVVTTEIKSPGSYLVLIEALTLDNLMPDYEDIKNKYSKVHDLIMKKKILSAHTVGYGGIAEAVCKMTFGNKIGVMFEDIENNKLFQKKYGSIILEINNLEELNSIGLDYELLGRTIETPEIKISGEIISIDEMINVWLNPLNNVFPVKEDINDNAIEYNYRNGNKIKKVKSIVKPRVFIPVFPGTNCEYDTAKAFEKAGGIADIFVFKNLSGEKIKDSVNIVAEKIRNSQIIAIPGGFSAGDEPEGSGKFITAVFRNPEIKDAVSDLLKNRDGLMIGICNGFQALIKLGLIQFGEIRDIEEDYPTLTYNIIGRHVSLIVKTKVVSNLSPWLNNCKVGEIHNIPVSHGEGRFVANEKWIDILNKNGQISTQYVDDNDKPTYNGFYNPNGSFQSIEGISSPDGRVLGKMGHSERVGDNLYKNIPGSKDQKLFEAGIKYYL